MSGGTDDGWRGAVEEVLDRIAAAPAPDGRPRVVGVMVASADGRTIVDGRSTPVAHPADRMLLRGMRALADAVLVGSTTIAAEGYGALLDDGEEARRAARGQPPHPLVVTISRALSLPAGADLFGDPAVPVLAFTAAGPEVPAPVVAASLEVERLDPARLGVEAVLDGLGRRGLRLVSCEGGPTLLGLLAAAGRLDDLLLTITPALVGGGGPTAVDHPRFNPPVPLALAGSFDSRDHLFLHYTAPGREPE